jgi:hypothetical protein
VDSNEEAVAGNGAFWEDATLRSDEGAIAGNGAFCEDDDSRSPTIAFDLELVSDPIGSGAQPTNPANNVTIASSLKPELCDMASSNPGNIHGGTSRFVAKLMAQIAVSELASPHPAAAGSTSHVG